MSRRDDVAGFADDVTQAGGMEIFALRHLRDIDDADMGLPGQHLMRA